ncbi:hypothetical protein ACH5AL_13375 [Actinacidiphila glaucinigra]|uniref:hypothetical protein n=1 Tax=Actinacidiphila glaucinigra TaxID=235986 RepID=UPI0037AB72FF
MGSVLGAARVPLCAAAAATLIVLCGPAAVADDRPGDDDSSGTSFQFGGGGGGGGGDDDGGSGNPLLQFGTNGDDDRDNGRQNSGNDDDDDDDSGRDNGRQNSDNDDDDDSGRDNGGRDNGGRDNDGGDNDGGDGSGRDDDGRQDNGSGSGPDDGGTGGVGGVGGTGGVGGVGGVGSGPVRITPGTAGPGADVDVRTDQCDRAKTGTVSSSAFVTPVTLAPASDGGMYASAVVRSGLTPGSYRVSITCDGKSHEGTLAVTEAASGFPSAPVPAGGGAMAAHQAAAERQPAGVPGVVAAGVLAVAGAAGLVVHRRRTRD